jgi:hypothetical protein
VRGIILLISLLSVQAFACPQIQGTFSCENEETGQMEPVSVSTRSIVNGAVYTITSNESAEEMIADGQPHEIPEAEGAEYVATCIGAKVRALVHAPIFDEEGTQVGEYNARNEYYLQRQNLVTESRISLTIGTETEVQELTTICQRIR